MYPQYTYDREIRDKDFHVKYLDDRYNQRLFVINCTGNIGAAIDQLKRIGNETGAGKIIAYVQRKQKRFFEQRAFIQEGRIEGYFRGQNACCFSYFIDSERRNSQRIKEEDTLLKALQDDQVRSAPGSLHEYVIRNVSEADASALADFMGSYFDTYPTPVHDPEYIKNAITGKYLFKIALFQGEIVCTASADCNQNLLNAEITDCLTHPAFRGQGLNSYLIDLLEEDLQKSGYITLFSLARAISPGMNRVFSNKEYHYGGRMVNNCSIMGAIEDMNIWSKMIGQNQA